MVTGHMWGTALHTSPKALGMSVSSGTCTVEERGSLSRRGKLGGLVLWPAGGCGDKGDRRPVISRLKWGIGLDSSQTRPSKQITLAGDRAGSMHSPLIPASPSKVMWGDFLLDLRSLRIRPFYSCSSTHRPSWLCSWRGLAWYRALSLIPTNSPQCTNTLTHTDTDTSHTDTDTYHTGPLRTFSCSQRSVTLLLTSYVYGNSLEV